MSLPQCPVRTPPLTCKPALFGPTCIFCHRVLDATPTVLPLKAAELFASDSIGQAVVQAAAEGRLPPPPPTGPCPLCAFEGATDSGCPACGSRFFRVVTLRDPEGQAVATPPLRPEVVEAARRIKRALHAEADRVAGIDTSRRRPLVDSLDEVRAELAGTLSMTQAERLLREDLPPLLDLLAAVRAVIDRSVADRTAMAAIDGWAEVRDLLYPDTDVARQCNARRRMTPAEHAAERERADAAEREAWQIPSDIPDAPPACPSCGKPLRRLQMMAPGMPRSQDAGEVCLDCSGLGKLLERKGDPGWPD